MGERVNILIVEDEDSSVNRLKKELAGIKGVEFTILNVLDSIKGAEDWLGMDNEAELIFMDIHLTDGLSLEIFKRVNVNCPVIFTTAYDEYALQAFKVNSIDYLLKPIEPEELRKAVEKFLGQTRKATMETYLEQFSRLTGAFIPPTHRSSFLVSFRQKMIMIDVSEVAYLYIKERGTYLKKRDGLEYIVDFFLDDMEKQLDPTKFYRANRQFLVARSSIQEIEPYFNGRLILKMRPEAYTSVVISKEKASHFKRWADY